MKNTLKITIISIIAAVIIIAAICLGNQSISLFDTVNTVIYKLFGAFGDKTLSDGVMSIVWSLRIPRVFMAFFVGAVLSVGGAVTQSILKNPLASPYTLGVSSGASLGAAVVIVFSLGFLGSLTLPMFGFIFGILTVILAIFFAKSSDKNMSANTIVLTGMIFALFANAVVSLLASAFSSKADRIYMWSLGSFVSTSATKAYIMLGVMLVAVAVAMYFSKELDILSFGEEQAKILGVNVKATKWLLLIIASATCGIAVSFVGVIGFVDLVAPHIARRIFGSRHRLIIPASAIIGGALTVLGDLAARSIVQGKELAVGAITAFIGVPFFIYVYFIQGGKRNGASKNK